MNGRKKTKAKNVKVELPDLTEIFNAFRDAQTLVVLQNSRAGKAVSVVYLGVEALESVSGKLEEAVMQFDRFRRKGGNLCGDASADPNAVREPVNPEAEQERQTADSELSAAKERPS